jgi:hypothetical protein
MRERVFRVQCANLATGTCQVDEKRASAATP